MSDPPSTNSASGIVDSGVKQVVCTECEKPVPQDNAIPYGSAFVCAECKPKFVQRLREGAVPGAKFIYAGFWIRFWATMIDAVLISIITLPILVLIYGWEYFDEDAYGFLAGPMDLLLSWILPAFGTIAFWARKQATPGKMLLAIKIVDARTGACPSTTQFIVRYLMYVYSLLPLGIGFLWIAINQRKQAWHDKVANTIVIRCKKPASQENTN